MPCYYPIDGWRAAARNENGKRPIVFNRNEGLVDFPVTVPCGRCIGCRLDRSREWAIRCMHELKSHEAASFITLTYDQDNLPLDGSLHVEDWQSFMKRFRKRVGVKLRYFMGAEYGENQDITSISRLGRPHFHAIIYGWDFPDRKPWKKDGLHVMYRSELLEALWPYGYSTIGSVTFDSAGYVARYCTKKIGGEEADEHYQSCNEYGELIQRRPEFGTMSRNPPIGGNWLEAFYEDCRKGFITLRGQKHPVPKSYLRQLEVINPELAEELKTQRQQAMEKDDPERRTDRLRVREQVKLIRTKQLTRKL